VRQEIVDTRDRLSGLVQVLDLPTAMPMTPTPVRVAAALPTARPMAVPTIVVTQTLTAALSALEDTDQQVAEAITATLTMTPSSAIAPTAVVTPTVMATLVATQLAPTRAPSPAVTASPTHTPTSAPAAKASPNSLPAATKASGVIYVVKSGDTLAGIGAQYGIAWQDLAAANNISAATGLQIGQTLRIPVAGALPAATPRPTATPAVAPTSSSMVSAPILENPADGSRADGERAEIELRWQPVPNMPAGALYQVTVQYVEGGQKRSDPLTPTASTGQRFPPWLYGRADLPGRRYTWFVTVVRMTTDGKGGEVAVPLSPPSVSRSFEWQ